MQLGLKTIWRRTFFKTFYVASLATVTAILWPTAPAAANPLIETIEVTAGTVYKREFDICDSARTVIVQTGSDNNLQFLIYDAGGNLVLFTKGEPSETDDTVAARIDVEKIEQLECETFSMLAINTGPENAPFTFALLPVRLNADGTRGNGTNFLSGASRFPRCPSNDPRCASIQD